MKYAIITIVAFFIGGCSSPVDSEHVKIMDDIEAQVQLPPNAEQLEYYARAYKYASSTTVVAMYFRPFDGEDFGFCESAKTYGTDNGQILLGCPPPDGMVGNERRWLSSETWLPMVDDGGCDYIEVEYDLPTKIVTKTRCNGVA